MSTFEMIFKQIRISLKNQNPGLGPNPPVFRCLSPIVFLLYCPSWSPNLRRQNRFDLNFEIKKKKNNQKLKRLEFDRSY